MPRNLLVRPAKALTDSVDYRVRLYCAAASAAGVSILALAQPADAEVVVTEANLPFNYLHSVSLDLNKDGIADFRFSIHLYEDYSFSSRVGVVPSRAATWLPARDCVAHTPPPWFGGQRLGLRHTLAQAHALTRAPSRLNEFEALLAARSIYTAIGGTARPTVFSA
jgi:hypothetical protein